MTLQSQKDDKKHSQDLFCYLFYFRLVRQAHDTIGKTIQRATATEKKTTQYAYIIPVQQQSGKDTENMMKLT